MKLLGIAIALLTLSTAARAQPAVPAADEGVEMDAGTHQVRLRDLERRVDTVRRDAFQSLAALSLLQEQYIGLMGYAQAQITHDSQLGPFFRLERMVYALDGMPIFNRTDVTGDLGRLGVLPIYDGALTPGEHVLSVRLQYTGDGNGVFSYLEGYTFTLHSSHAFTAPTDRSIRIDVRAVERGGPTRPTTERPALEFRETLGDRR